MHIIGINGFKRSGKGTVADMLANQNEHLNVRQIGFADKVKIAGARALGFLTLSENECIGLMDKAKERWVFEIANERPLGFEDPGPPSLDYPFHTLTGREYLQNIGTEMRKLFGDDFWVDQVLPKPRFDAAGANQVNLHVVYPDVDIVAITDLRFENEAQRVLDLGGVVWRVSRPGFGSDGHDSEQRLPDELITYEIENAGTLADLDREVFEATAQTLRSPEPDPPCSGSGYAHKPHGNCPGYTYDRT